MWTYNYQRPNELYHYGVKGMKWGIRHNPERERKRQAKEEYKKTKKMLDAEDSRLYNVYSKQYTDLYKQRDYKKKILKKAYRKKQISKDDYKKHVDNLNKSYKQAQHDIEQAMLKGRYRVARQQSANELVYVGEIKGEQSKKYKKGLEAYKSGIEYINTGSRYYVVKPNGKR